MPDYPVTYYYDPTGVWAWVPALPTIGAIAPTYELARARIQEAMAQHPVSSTGQAFQPDEADDTLGLPTVLDACPCPDCNMPIVWTTQAGVRTAWSVHQCPRSGGRPL